MVDINLSISKSHTTSIPPPILLRVCSESRSVVLRHYHRSFTTSKHPSGTFIDPLVDTILLLPPCPASCYQSPNCFECFHFDYYFRLNRYDDSSMKCVQNVAIYNCGLEGLASVWKLFPRMRSLKTVLDDHWTALLQREHPIKRIVEGLLEKAKEDFPVEFGNLEMPKVKVLSTGG